MPLGEVSGRLVEVLRAEAGQNGVRRQGEALHPVAVKTNLNLPNLGADNHHLGHTVEPLQPLGDLVLGDVLHLEERAFPAHPVHEHGDLGEVELDDRRFLRLFGEIPLVLGDRLPDILSGEVQVRPPFELDVDQGDSLFGEGLNLLHV